MRRKNTKKGFTLLELLVVVVIIGILAGIALPQYKYAVTKSRYSTMKNIIKSVVQAQQDYYLINNQYTTKFSDLIIDIHCQNGNDSRRCNISDKISAYLNDDQTYGILTIAGTVQLYFASFYNISNYNISNKKYCQANKSNISSSDFVYKFCQKETGQTTPWLSGTDYAAFLY